MKNRLIVILGLLTLSSAYYIQAQQPTQTIRGSVIDRDSKVPLFGATILIIDSEPTIGTISDPNGNFRLDHIGVGRITLRVSHVGYHDRFISEILLISGKETVLDIEMIELLTHIDEVKIFAKKNKSETLNDMVQISGKAFSVEETNRYAGAINDPARMVASFAGVTGDANGKNDIVVRGNSPQGVLWRLEGIEIPNPNHFANEGGTGGPISALNSSMLGNSDFYSGAFAAEYGNAYSGVFDIKLRNGNNERREYSFSLGIMGADLTAEGPIIKGTSSSYLLNYRYSTLAIIDRLRLANFYGVPKYQDASFKVILSSKRAGTFTLFGLFGKSNIVQEYRDAGDKNEEGLLYASMLFFADLNVVGLKNTFLISDKSFLTSSISYSGTRTGNTFDLLNDESEFTRIQENDIKQAATKISTTLNNKFNSRNSLKTGLVFTALSYNLFSDGSYNPEIQVADLNEKGSTGMFQAFTSWKFRINDHLTMISGIHLNYLDLNHNYSLEPRISLKWNINPKQSLSAGFGNHSKNLPISTYLARKTLPDGTIISPNKDIKPPKARHYVVGYENIVSQNLFFRTELYFQDLYQIPVENNVNSSYSTLNNNEGWSNIPLINKGTGYNYGIETTIEKFFSDTYYLLFTASLFNSKYRALDGIERDTRYNGNYAGNLLAGKEFHFGRNKNVRVLAVNARISLIGGARYTPIDLEKSIEQQREILQIDKPFSVKGSNIFRADLSLSLRRNRNHSSGELKLEIQNLTQNQGMVSPFYNYRTESIAFWTQSPMFPVISYKIDF